MYCFFYSLDDDHLESSSICETEYSYKTDEHPELDMLISLSPEYGTPRRDPITGKRIRPTAKPHTYDTHDFPDEISLSSLDPALMVIPTSAKAYSGVAQYRDFIRYLPVHLAKYILRLLDEASLHAAKDVCAKWQVLVSEVKVELELNKKLMEEVMLMQVWYIYNSVFSSSHDEHLFLSPRSAKLCSNQ